MIARGAVPAAMFAMLALEPASAKSLLDGVDPSFGAGTPAPHDDGGYAAATASVDAVWTRMPLRVQRALFVKHKADGYGLYEERPTNEFAVGETLYFYAEPLGYLWKPESTSGYSFGATADLAIKDDIGATLYVQPAFANLKLVSHDKNRELMINFDVSLTGLKPGSYKLDVTLHDRNSAKTTSFTLPFKLVGRA